MRDWMNSLQQDGLLGPRLCAMLPDDLSPFLMGGGSGYVINQSIQFSAADSQYLTWTPSVAGDRKTWTFSVWFRVSSFGTIRKILVADDGSPTGDDDRFDIALSAADEIALFTQPTAYRVSDAKILDPTAWYHLVVASDTPNAVTEDRLRAWLNGEELTWRVNVPITQNQDWAINNTVVHNLGRYDYGATGYWDGNLADATFIDGQALTSDSFGEEDDNGVWRPKNLAGLTFGTNGFLLQDATGTDQSGNGNNFTPVNAPTDSSDVPTDDPALDLGNYARWNGLYTVPTRTTVVPSEAGRKVDYPSSISQTATATLSIHPGMKTYLEMKCVQVDTFHAWGVGPVNYQGESGQITGGTAGTGTFATIQNGDVIGFAADHDAGTVAITKNGVAVTTVTGVDNSSAWSVSIGMAGVTTGSAYGFFDPGEWTYSAPSGFKPLCTAHLPAKTPKNPGAHVGVVTWTGNGAVRSITGLGFQPDFVWVKGRNQPTAPGIQDSVRGATKELSPSATTAETTYLDSITSFDNDGFSLGADTSTHYNFNATTYVAWCIGGLTHMTGPEIAALVTSTGADITPSAIAYDADLGFAIVKAPFTNSFSGVTFPNPLGQAPAMIIGKPLVSSNWSVFHEDVGATKYLLLNDTAAEVVSSGAWNDTAPTSSLVSLGTATHWTGGVAGDYVFYLFANTDTIKIGSYTGNGNADGPFVDLGGSLLWDIIKHTDVGPDGWRVHDTKRSPHNPVNEILYPNSSGAEQGNDDLDAIASGVKIRTSATQMNASGGTYIYLAFLKHHFGGANVTQGKAR